jgi:hypothetical protein
VKSALVIIVALSCACSARTPAPAPWIQAAAEASRAADRAIVDGQLDRARSLLRGLIASPVPPSLAAQDQRAVVQDAYFRLAEVELRAHAAAAARAWADRGLALGEAGDLFTANLLIVRGRARAALDDAHGAAADYRAAMAINEALLARLTEGP